jgi:hypothetical protein
MLHGSYGALRIVMVTSIKEKNTEVRERTTRDLIICGVTGGLFGAIIGAPFSILSYLMWKSVGVKGVARWWAWGLSGVVITPVMLGVIAASNNVNKASSNNTPSQTRPIDVTPPKPVEDSAAPPRQVEEAITRPKRAEETKPLTIDKFNQISMGMTYEEVYGVIGVHGAEQSRSQFGEMTTVMIQWQNPGMMAGNMNVIFQNGKASSKAQFGLK